MKYFCLGIILFIKKYLGYLEWILILLFSHIRGIDKQDKEVKMYQSKNLLKGNQLKKNSITAKREVASVSNLKPLKIKWGWIRYFFLSIDIILGRLAIIPKKLFFTF